MYVPLGESPNIAGLAACRDAGLMLRLRPFETIVKVSVEDLTVSILVSTYEIDERAREFRLTKHGSKIMSWTRPSVDQNWSYIGRFIIWDTDFKPEVHVKFGKSTTPAEYSARLAWERDVHAPGSDSNPMDSYSRCSEGPSPMERYW